jgi:hypothetical protein
MATGVAWATVQDVEDLVGSAATEDVDKTQRLLERATAVVASYICWPLEPMDPDLVPGPVREAVATLAARALTGSQGGAGAVASEVMGGYSYRLTQPASAADAMRITPDIATLLSGYRCGGGSASVVVCDSCGCNGGSCACGGYVTYPPPGTTYAAGGSKGDGYYNYLMAPFNDVGSPFNSGRPGQWWREMYANEHHAGTKTLQ